MASISVKLASFNLWLHVNEWLLLSLLFYDFISFAIFFLAMLIFYSSSFFHCTFSAFFARFRYNFCLPSSLVLPRIGERVASITTDNAALGIFATKDELTRFMLGWLNLCWCFQAGWAVGWLADWKTPVTAATAKLNFDLPLNLACHHRNPNWKFEFFASQHRFIPNFQFRHRNAIIPYLESR